MKLLTTIIAFIGLIITLAFTVFPIGYLTIFPAIITILCGIILYKINSNEEKSILLPKLLIGLAIIGAIISLSRGYLTSDIVAEDETFEQRQEKSNQDAIDDLEGLE